MSRKLTRIVLVAVLTMTTCICQAQLSSQTDRARVARQIDANLWLAFGWPALLQLPGETPIFDRNRVVLILCAMDPGPLPEGCLRYFDTGQSVGHQVALTKNQKPQVNTTGFQLSWTVTVDGKPGYTLWKPKHRSSDVQEGVRFHYDDTYPIRSFRITFPSIRESNPSSCCDVWLGTEPGVKPAWSHVFLLDRLKAGEETDGNYRYESINGFLVWPNADVGYVHWRQGTAVIDMKSGKLLSNGGLVRSLPFEDLVRFEQEVGDLILPDGVLVAPEDAPWRIVWNEESGQDFPEGIDIGLVHPRLEDERLYGDEKLARRWRGEMQKRLTARLR